MRPLELNGVKFTPLPDVSYMHDYGELLLSLPPGKSGADRRKEICRKLILDDLWFYVYFAMGVSIANHPWWIERCREVQTTRKDRMLFLWARFHGKTTIISEGDTTRRILMNPEERICVFSHKQSVSQSVVRNIKFQLETNSFLKALFPDILYEDAKSEAWKWAEAHGIYVKRKGAYREPTLMAAGLSEGMPTGFHFSGRVYDDIVTPDLVNTPEVMERLSEMFDYSQNLKTGTSADWHRVIGTTYHHQDLLMQLKGRKDSKGEPVYKVSFRPATEDGTPNGKSVYLPEDELDLLRSNKRLFFSQQLLDPTPYTDVVLNHENLKEVLTSEIPKELFKFMLVDSAGSSKRKDRQDSWALGVIGVAPFADDLGASDLYILDLIIEPMDLVRALDEVVSMYARGGRILKLGVEKVGIMTMEIHIANALRARGFNLSLGSNLVILSPAGRKKQERIEENLAWPLNHGKVHISAAVPEATRERLKTEMKRFPYWHDDGLDILSYAYDLTKQYKFSKRNGMILFEDEQGRIDLWEKARLRQRRGEQSDRWMHLLPT